MSPPQPCLESTLREVGLLSKNGLSFKVGAKESATIIQKHMKSGGRVVVIGVISQYNSTEEENGL